MKTRAFLTVLLITVLALASSGMAQEVCSAETLKGMYEVTCTGWAKLGPPILQEPTLVPTAAQGIFTNKVEDGKISSSGSFNLSLGGIQIISNWSSSPTDVNPNCTVTFPFNVTYNVPKPDEVIDISVVALDQGREFRSFSKPDGLVITCSGRLMSRNTN